LGFFPCLSNRSVLDAFATVDIPARKNPLSHGRLNASLQQHYFSFYSEYRPGHYLRILIEYERTVQAHQPLRLRRFYHALFQIAAAARAKPIFDMAMSMMVF
jgi:hypothetical protein